jgi:hypothetical protein
MNFIKGKKPRMLITIILKEKGIIPSFLIIKIIISLRNKGLSKSFSLPRVMTPLSRRKNIFYCAFGESNSFMFWIIFARGMGQKD